MKNRVYLPILTLLLSACTHKQLGTEKKLRDTTNIVLADTSKPAPKSVQKPAPKKEFTSRLDSIEKTNNASVIASGDDVTKAYVYLHGGDSTINLTAYMRKDHRFFGYAAPDVTSERLILFSIFTDDVQNNPFGCKLGAYYETRMDSLTLKYVSTKGNFIQAKAINKTNQSTTVYFEKKWIDFE
ncbi:hypothetical protein DBR11_08700 [Pedobacter sp. HMWF019]|uniref:hypothetical protein n=1 Tax=Pedobacter sp. HMWF019 TaxID=2056856 RepID=UPI000D33243F|nr:hypothetical protein [Pedobacter sp. HMWF019]PTT00908.1 hypothetical protein DBR11_08700 [Pedobacter sp. HMWF019]